jgi:hypothetical protein
MENQDRNDDLLKDVFGEEANLDFREGLLHQTLQAVQSRKRLRRWNRRLLAGACAVVTLVVAAKLFLPPGEVRLRTASDASPFLVHSEALGADMLVRTQPGSVAMAHSSPEIVAVIRTVPGQISLEIIGDQELLALLAGRPAALVHRSPLEAELVFLNPDDQDGFPVQ